MQVPTKKNNKPRAQKIERLKEEDLKKLYPKPKQTTIPTNSQPIRLTSYSALEYQNIKKPIEKADILDKLDDRIKVLEKGSRWLIGPQGRYLLGGLILFGLASTYYRSTQLSKRENVFNSN